MVPAVTEVWRPQSAHSNVQALVCSCQALPPPHPGQINPSGQRVAIRYCAHAASSLKRCWNSSKERGKSVMAAAEVWCVPDMFYQESTLAATTFWATGRRGIRLTSRRRACRTNRVRPYYRRVARERRRIGQEEGDTTSSIPAGYRVTDTPCPPNEPIFRSETDLLDGRRYWNRLPLDPTLDRQDMAWPFAFDPVRE